MKEIVIIFIRNSAGEYFVHQRLSTKKTFPNKYGLGAGGHMDEGENKEQAAKRELLEETSLTTPVEYLFTQDFDEPDDVWRSHLFVTETDDQLVTDESEWQWSGWMRKEVVNKLYAEGKFYTDTATLYQMYSSSLAG